MYAIIVTGGKQYKVEEGSSIYVEKLDAKEGDKVTFDQVVFVGGDSTKIGTPLVDGASVVRKRRLLLSSTSLRSTPTLSKVTVNHTLRLLLTRSMLNAEVNNDSGNF